MTKRAEAVIQRLFSEILSGAKGVDGKLPAAQSLAAEYGISTASVREALMVLKSIGIVTLVQGRGIMVERRDGIAEELLGARVILERWNAHEAAKNRGADDIERFRRLLKSMDSAYDLKHTDLYTDLDTRLHLQIADLTGNRILKGTLENIRIALHSLQLEVNRIPQILSRSHADHHELVEAIIVGDPKRAADAMEIHIVHVRDRWLATLRAVSLPSTSE